MRKFYDVDFMLESSLYLWQGAILEKKQIFLFQNAHKTVEKTVEIQLHTDRVKMFSLLLIAVILCILFKILNVADYPGESLVRGVFVLVFNT